MKHRSSPFVQASWSRRRFVRGLTAGGIALIGASQLSSTRAFAAATDARVYTTARPVLDLEGVAVMLGSVSGGAAFADITKEPDVGDGLTHLRPGPPKYEDIVIQTPLDGLPPSLVSWINNTLTKAPTPKNGAIAYLDVNMAQRKRLEFTNAFLTEVALPACTASDASAAYLTLRLTPERTQIVDGTAAKPLSLPPTSQKRATTNNFGLSIEKLEDASKRAAKISAISAKRSAAAPTLGVTKIATVPRAPLEISVVSITLAEQDALPFYSAWFAKSTLVGIPDERGMLIDWFAPDRTKLVTAALGGVGILRYEPLPTSANSDAIAQVQIDLYAETLSLKA